VVRVVKSPARLGTSFRVPYEAHGAKHLSFVTVAIESKYLVSSGVVKDGANSSKTAGNDEGVDHVLDELKAALEIR